MCLIVISHLEDSRFPLIVMANRDEFYQRPTREASFWKENLSILAGRDLVAGGTWFGITREGRFAALTNYRTMKNPPSNPLSRGELVKGFLESSCSPLEYLQQINSQRDLYAPFNLLVRAEEELWFYSNREGQERKLSPGLYGLSNHLLDTPWPKVERIKGALRNFLGSHSSLEAAPLLEMLKSREIAQDATLPNTGVGLEMERMLSPVFIQSQAYGTRCSTVLWVEEKSKQNNESEKGCPREVFFEERTFDSSGKEKDLRQYSFEIPANLTGKKKCNRSPLSHLSLRTER